MMARYVYDGAAVMVSMSAPFWVQDGTHWFLFYGGALLLLIRIACGVVDLVNKIWRNDKQGK